MVKDLHALQKAGVVVRLVHLVAPNADDGTRALEHEGIAVRRVPCNPLNPLSIAAAARQLPALLRGADVVHSMAMSSLPVLALARPRQPWVHTEHWSGLTNPDTLPAHLRAARLPVLVLERLPQIVTAVCPYLSAPLRAARGARPTVEVPCVVEPVADLRARRLLAPGDTWELISVGGLVERKDPLFAVKVVEVLQKRGHRVRLTWLGDGPLRQQTARAARQAGVELVLAGSQPFTEVSRALSRSDLFLGPTHGDNFFVSCAEAILHGRPVVVGDAGGHPDYMRDFVGRALPGHDPQMFAQAVEDMLASPVGDRPGGQQPNNGQPSAEQIAGSIGQAFASQTVGRSYRQVYEAALAGGAAQDQLLADLPSWCGW